MSFFGGRDGYENEIDKLESFIKKQSSLLTECQAVLEEFVSAVDATNEATFSVFQIAAIHGCPYTGPTHSEALTKAREMLAKLAPHLKDSGAGEIAGTPATDAKHPLEKLK